MIRAKTIFEKFKEQSDPIKDMGIGAFRVFIIEVNLEGEEWQINDGVDIVVAHSKKEAIEIWKKEHAKHYYGDKPKIRTIKEISYVKPGFYHVADANVE